MSRKVAYFNTVKEFLTGLRGVFPEIKADLCKLESYITTAESTFPKIVISQFMDRIAKFYVEIIDNNEEFFRTNLNYNETFENTCAELDLSARIKLLMDNILRFVGKEWDVSLRNTHKEEIWMYLETMLVTGAYAYDNGKKYQHIIVYAKEKQQKLQNDA